jgi:hypothetical protein
MLRHFLIIGSVFLFLASPVFAADPPAVKVDPADPLAAAWKDLLSSDETVSTRAALTLASKPDQSVKFLKEKLRPVKADPKTVSRLMEELGSKDFQTREAAQQELEYLSKYVKKDLEEATKSSDTSEEAKERAKKLLGRLEAEEKEAKTAEEKPAPANPFGGGGSVSIRSVNGVTQIFVNGKPIDTTPKVIVKLEPLPSWKRASRAIGVLEHIGTPEAIKVLEELCLGEDTATPTKQATDALARLKRKK